MTTIRALASSHNWKRLARWNGEGFYELRTEDIRDVPVRMSLTPRLLEDAKPVTFARSSTRLGSLESNS